MLLCFTLKIEKGKSMVEDVASQAEKLGKDAASQAQNMGNTLKNTGLSAVNKAKQAGMGALDKAKQTGQGLVRQGQGALGELLHHFENMILSLRWEIILNCCLSPNYIGCCYYCTVPFIKWL